MQNVIDKDLFILTLITDKRRPTGKVKLTAKNVAGEATTEGNLSFAGTPPTFLEIPYISKVLQGTTILLDILHVKTVRFLANVHVKKVMSTMPLQGV